MGTMENIQAQASKVLGTSNNQLTQAIARIIEDCGGVEGVVKKFRDNGLGDVVNSWISKEPNKSVTPEQVNRALGPDTVQRAANSVGMDSSSLSQQLATYLPMLIDKLSPEGVAPSGDWWHRSLDKAKEFLGLNKH